MIRDVETDDGRIEPYVGLCEMRTEEVGSFGLVLGEVGFDAVEGFELVINPISTLSPKSQSRLIRGRC